MPLRSEWEWLRRRERALADLFEQAPMALLWVSRQGRIERGNLTARQWLGCGSRDITGRKISEFMVEEELVADALVRLAARRTVYNLQASLRAPDGSRRTVLIDANGLWEQGRFVHSRWFVRDITARKELEREVLAISERERRHVAQDLHDGLGQHLSGIGYLSNVLQQELTEKGWPSAAADARRLTRLAQEAVQLTRDLARGLLPVRPDPEGFADAVREMAARMRHVFKIDCRFVSRGALIHDETVATHLYRIAQEAVTNAIRHGKATKIKVMLTQTARHLRLVVRDNGRGLRRLRPDRTGMGLRVMQYRADLIQGTLSIRPRPRGGTEVACAMSRPRARFANQGLTQAAHRSRARRHG